MWNRAGRLASRALVAGALLVGVLVACSGGEASPSACTSESCTCEEGPRCDLDCGGADRCAPACKSFGGDCTARCQDHCSYACESGPNCNVTCGADCAVRCKSTSTCGAVCGERCNYTCESVNDCAPKVGAASVVTCTSVGNCNVTCSGACRVRCVSSGNCNVSCPSGAEKTKCNDGWSCGQAC
ncbi:MAG TPA: hypothetical protein VM580_16320 [Labilithrix sp.]|nr:hypothetical protein [Labilithrix sp.]